MTLEDFQNKLRELAQAAGKSSAETEELITMLLHFEGSVSELMKKLS